ncbi:MAG TPA: PAS domain S-box protein [Pedobacter sp.]
METLSKNNSDQILELLFQENLQPMWIYRLRDLHILDVNEAAISMYGYTREEFLNLTLKELRSKREQELFSSVFSQFDLEKKNTMDVHHMDKYGNAFWVQIVSLPLFYGDAKSRLVTVSNIQELLDHKAELVKNAAALQRVLNNSLDVICSFDHEGRFIQCSRASKQVWGYEPEELIGTPYMQLIVEDDRELTQQVATRLTSGLDVTNFQNRYKRKDGSIVYILWSARWDEQEQTMFCIARDATDKVNAERLSQEQAQRIITVVESIRDGFMTLDRNWVVTYWNCEAERMLQMPREKILHKNVWDVYADAIPLKFYTEYHRAVQENIPVHFEEYLPQADVWFDVTAYPSVDGLSVYFRDITERKRAEVIIKDAKERYDILNRATNDIIWDWNLTTNEIEWNAALKQTLGFEPEKSKNGDWWLENIHVDDRERVAKKIHNVIKESGSWSDEYRFRCANGGYKFFLERGYLIHNDEGVAVRMIGSMQDITELKKKQDEVGERNKKILEIAHVNSHQVRKPLANILGIVEMLGMVEGDDQKELLRMLKASSKELDLCLRDIADKAYFIEKDRE